MCRFLSYLVVAGSVIVLHEAASGEPPADQVAARVDGEEILLREVEREIRIAFGDREVAPDARRALQRKTLEQIVKRRLILNWLSESKQGASSEEVDRGVRQLGERLEKRGSTLDQFLAEQDLDEASLRRSISWQIGWGRYLSKQLADKNLERFYTKNRRQFDGTELRVAHILFRVDSMATDEEWRQARSKAAEYLSQIRGGTLSFGDAARRYSESPSREQNGEIGFISRQQPMPETFSAAAFELEPNEISEPVTTSFGVHLIQCLEVKAGNKTWQEVRAELEQAVTQYLFDWAAEQGKRTAKVELLWQ